MNTIHRLLVAVILILSPFSSIPTAQAGIWDSLGFRPIIIPTGEATAERPAAYALPGQDAPQKLVNQFCERVVSCMPGEDANSVRWQCVLRLTGDEGKNLWAGMLTNHQEDPPTTLELSRWIRQKNGRADPPKYYACLNGLKEFSCEAIQGGYSSTDMTWAGAVIASAGTCNEVFTGPLTGEEFETKGTIHVFARCLDEAGEGKACHWQAPPGGNLWGSQYWFHQLPMEAGLPISVDYHHESKLLSMAAYVKDGGDLGGAGSAHVSLCKTDAFEKDAFQCGPDSRVATDKVHYNPLPWNAPIFVSGSEAPFLLNVFFNTGTWPLPGGSSFQTGLVGMKLQSGWSGDFVAAEFSDFEDPYPWGLEGSDGRDCNRAIDHSPSFLVMEPEEDRPFLHLFGKGDGNRIFHAWSPYPPGREISGYINACKLYETGSDVSSINSSPKAIWGADNYTMELYGLGEDNYPTRWVIQNFSISSEKLAPTKADMKIDNWLGVVLSPVDRSTHVFYRKEGSKDIGWVRLDPAAGIWRSPEGEGLSHYQVLDSPSAVTDLEGNIHLFVGEKDGRQKPGEDRAYLLHFVKAVGSDDWKSERLFLGNVQHSEDGRSASSALFISPEGQTTERKTLPFGAIVAGAGAGGNPTDPTNLGVADPSRCAEGYLYQETPYCEEAVGTTDPRGTVISEAYACNWEVQHTQESAHAAGLCPPHLHYTEYGRQSFACRGDCVLDVDRCPSGLGYGCDEAYKATGIYYCSLPGDSGPCAGGTFRAYRRSQHLGFANQYCCVK